MKNRRLVIIFVPALLLLAALAVIFWPQEPIPEDAVSVKDIVSFCVGDVTGDGVPELLVISGSGKITDDDFAADERYGQLLLVCDASIAHNLTSLRYIPAEKIYYSIDLAGIKPMKVQIGDINGDGINEVAICVYKTAKFHEVMAKRPFFFDLVEGNLIPVWLGSRLSRPFDDYVLFDVNADGVDEIVSIEHLENGGRVVALYEWKGFGFEVITQSDALEGKKPRFDLETPWAAGDIAEISVLFSDSTKHVRLIFNLKENEG